MTRYGITTEYFNWLTSIVCEQRFANGVSFDKLLSQLHDIEFRYIIPKDENRAEDGVDLRYRFALTYGHEHEVDQVLYYLDYVGGSCSVLEMMIALAIRCEENIMDDPRLGDRRSQWFWDMVVNLGLGGMTDDRYDDAYVDEVVSRFLDREYKPNGEGGLFTINNCKYDLRDVEIWYQLNWYLDNIT